MWFSLCRGTRWRLHGDSRMGREQRKQSCETKFTFTGQQAVEHGFIDPVMRRLKRTIVQLDMADTLRRQAGHIVPASAAADDVERVDAKAHLRAQGMGDLKRL